MLEGLQSAWESLLDWSEEKGLPLKGLANSLEEKGIPALPVALLLVLCLAFLSYTFLVAKAPTPTSSLLVTVRDSSGLPVSGASVFVTSTDSSFGRKSGNTSDAGKVSFSDLPIGPATITVYSSDHDSQPEKVQIAKGKNEKELIVTATELKKVDFNVLVKGVADNSNTVLTFQDDAGSEVDKAEGDTASFPAESGKTYYVKANADGFREELCQVASSDGSVSVTGNSSACTFLSDTKTLVVRLVEKDKEDFVPLHVRVDDESGIPVFGAQVEVLDAVTGGVIAKQLQSGEDGSVEPVLLPPGSFVTVVARARNYVTNTTNYTASVESLLSLLLQRAAGKTKKISVSVFDSSDNSPLSSPTIRVYSQGNFVEEKTPDDGVAEFEVTAKEKQSVTAYKRNFLPKFEDGVGDTTQLYLVPNNGENAGTVKVKARDSKGEVAGASVSLYSGGKPIGLPEGKTGLDGLAFFDDVPLGKVTAKASFEGAIGEADAIVTLEGTPDENGTLIEVTLKPVPSKVGVLVKDHFSGKPVEKASVLIATSSSANCTTNRNGNCDLTVLAGEGKAEVKAKGFGDFYSDSFLVKPNSQNKFSFDLISSAVTDKTKLVFEGFFDLTGKRVLTLQPLTSYNAKFAINSPQFDFNSAEAHMRLGSEVSPLDSEPVEIKSFSGDARIAYGDNYDFAQGYSGESVDLNNTLPSGSESGQIKWVNYRFQKFSGTKEFSVQFRTKSVVNASFELQARSAYYLSNETIRDPFDNEAGVSKHPVLANARAIPGQISFAGECQEEVCLQAFIEVSPGKQVQVQDYEASVPSEFKFKFNILAPKETVKAVMTSSTKALVIVDGSSGASKAKVSSGEGAKAELQALGDGSFLVKPVKASKDAVLDLRVETNQTAFEKSYSLRVVNANQKLKVVFSPKSVYALEDNTMVFTVTDSFGNPVDGARVTIGGKGAVPELVEATQDTSVTNSSVYRIEGMQPTGVGFAPVKVEAEGFSSYRGQLPVLARKLFDLQEKSVSMAVTDKSGKENPLQVTNLLRNEITVKAKLFLSQSPKITALSLTPTSLKLKDSESKAVNFFAKVSDIILGIAAKSGTLNETISGKITFTSRLGRSEQKEDVPFTVSTNFLQKQISQVWQADPDSLSFSVEKGKSDNQVVTITNDGVEPLLINQQARVKGIKIEPLSTVVQGGESASFNITAFVPMDVASKDCMLMEPKLNGSIDFFASFQGLNSRKIIKVETEVKVPDSCGPENARSVKTPAKAIFDIPDGALYKENADGTIVVQVGSERFLFDGSLNGRKVIVEKGGEIKVPAARAIVTDANKNAFRLLFPMRVSFVVEDKIATLETEDGLELFTSGDYEIVIPRDSQCNSDNGMRDCSVEKERQIILQALLFQGDGFAPPIRFIVKYPERAAAIDFGNGTYLRFADKTAIKFPLEATPNYQSREIVTAKDKFIQFSTQFITIGDGAKGGKTFTLTLPTSWQAVIPIDYKSVTMQDDSDPVRGLQFATSSSRVILNDDTTIVFSKPIKLKPKQENWIDVSPGESVSFEIAASGDLATAQPGGSLRSFMVSVESKIILPVGSQVSKDGSISTVSLPGCNALEWVTSDGVRKLKLPEASKVVFNRATLTEKDDKTIEVTILASSRSFLQVCRNTPYSVSFNYDTSMVMPGTANPSGAISSGGAISPKTISKIAFDSGSDSTSTNPGKIDLGKCSEVVLQQKAFASAGGASAPESELSLGYWQFVDASAGKLVNAPVTPTKTSPTKTTTKSRETTSFDSGTFAPAAAQITRLFLSKGKSLQLIPCDKPVDAPTKIIFGNSNLFKFDPEPNSFNIELTGEDKEDSFTVKVCNTAKSPISLVASIDKSLQEIVPDPTLVTGATREELSLLIDPPNNKETNACQDVKVTVKVPSNAFSDKKYPNCITSQVSLTGRIYFQATNYAKGSKVSDDELLFSPPQPENGITVNVHTTPSTSDNCRDMMSEDAQTFATGFNVIGPVYDYTNPEPWAMYFKGPSLSGPTEPKQVQTFVLLNNQEKPLKAAIKLGDSSSYLDCEMFSIGGTTGESISNSVEVEIPAGSRKLVTCAAKSSLSFGSPGSESEKLEGKIQIKDASASSSDDPLGSIRVVIFNPSTVYKYLAVTSPQGLKDFIAPRAASSGTGGSTAPKKRTFQGAMSTLEFDSGTTPSSPTTTTGASGTTTGTTSTPSAAATSNFDYMRCVRNYCGEDGSVLSIAGMIEATGNSVLLKLGLPKEVKKTGAEVFTAETKVTTATPDSKNKESDATAFQGKLKQYCNSNPTTFKKVFLLKKTETHDLSANDMISAALQELSGNSKWGKTKTTTTLNQNIFGAGTYWFSFTFDFAPFCISSDAKAINSPADFYNQVKLQVAVGSVDKIGNEASNLPLLLSYYPKTDPSDPKSDDTIQVIIGKSNVEVGDQVNPLKVVEGVMKLTKHVGDLIGGKFQQEGPASLLSLLDMGVITLGDHQMGATPDESQDKYDKKAYDDFMKVFYGGKGTPTVPQRYENRQYCSDSAGEQGKRVAVYGIGGLAVGCTVSVIGSALSAGAFSPSMIPGCVVPTAFTALATGASGCVGTFVGGSVGGASDCKKANSCLESMAYSAITTIVPVKLGVGSATTGLKEAFLAEFKSLLSVKSAVTVGSTFALSTVAGGLQKDFGTEEEQVRQSYLPYYLGATAIQTIVRKVDFGSARAALTVLEKVGLPTGPLSLASDIAKDPDAVKILKKLGKSAPDAEVAEFVTMWAATKGKMTPAQFTAQILQSKASKMSIWETELGLVKSNYKFSVDFSALSNKDLIAKANNLDALELKISSASKYMNPADARDLATKIETYLNTPVPKGASKPPLAPDLVAKLEELKKAGAILDTEMNQLKALSNEVIEFRAARKVASELATTRLEEIGIQGATGNAAKELAKVSGKRQTGFSKVWESGKTTALFEVLKFVLPLLIRADVRPIRAELDPTIADYVVIANDIGDRREPSIYSVCLLKQKPGVDATGKSTLKGDDTDCVQRVSFSPRLLKETTTPGTAWDAFIAVHDYSEDGLAQKKSGHLVLIMLFDKNLPTEDLFKAVFVPQEGISKDLIGKNVGIGSFDIGNKKLVITRSQTVQFK